MDGYCIDLPIPFEDRMVVAGIMSMFVAFVVAKLIDKFWPKHAIRGKDLVVLVAAVTLILSFVMALVTCNR